MKLSIIIVSWNVKDLLYKLLESIFYYTRDLEFEVIVVDNNSSDGTVGMIKRQNGEAIKTGQLRIIANKENAGFAKANNQGLEIAKGDYIIFMNPDMELVENSFGKIIDYFSANPRVDICAVKLLYPDLTVQPNVKKDPDWRSQAMILLKMHHLTQSKSVKEYLRKDFNYDQESEVEQVMGAFLAMPRAAALKLNGWNEDFWLWWEDVDLCRRARETGMTIKYWPGTKIIHHEGKSFQQKNSLVKQRRFNKGMLLYFAQHGGRGEYALLKSLQPISLTLALMAQLADVKPKTQSKISQ